MSDGSECEADTSAHQMLGNAMQVVIPTRTPDTFRQKLLGRPVLNWQCIRLKWRSSQAISSIMSFANHVWYYHGHLLSGDACAKDQANVFWINIATLAHTRCIRHGIQAATETNIRTNVQIPCNQRSVEMRKICVNAD